MHRIPRNKGLDSTLALLHDPYRLIARRCRLHGSDLFETRLLLQKTLCMSGAEAARLFYDPERFVRQGAMSPWLQKTLFGVGGEGLDGEAHRHRKHMFVALLMDSERVARLVETVHGQWQTYARGWERMEKVVLYDVLQDMLTWAVCAWAGILLAEEEAGPRARDRSFVRLRRIGGAEAVAFASGTQTERGLDRRAGRVDPSRPTAASRRDGRPDDFLASRAR
ncbi:hypothetical protein [Azorhizophilus paspali]|uniref:Cytochrome P450 n=1 Tax=Azorhizophilus paspali TaxID=69963 RepID=A0ABV6SQV2_AZOPA